jgi:hypothetical protein
MSKTETTLTCTFHPKVETQLRCNRCNQPICIKCVTHTPTGYRCHECIRSQQKIFVTTKWFDQVIAVAITGVISFLGSLFASNLGIYLMILIAFGTGYVIVWAVKKAINNRRSPLLKYIMSGSALLGSIIPVFGMLIRNFRYYGTIFGGGLYSILWYLAYSVILTGYVYYQLRN